MTYRAFVLAAAAATLLAGAPHAFADELTGASASLGEGTVTSYAELGDDGAPVEIGIVLSPRALDGLPAEHNPDSPCVDLDEDGRIEHETECLGDYELHLPLPDELAGREDIPFTFALLNWNPHGHPPQAWKEPHLDIHFYTEPFSLIDSMEPGPCGFFMTCEDFERAVKPVPEKYIHPDFANVEAAVVRMGNHLIDTKSPELGDPPQPFTHTWIYGSYDGRIIFYEVMATRDFMAETDDLCAEVKQPEACEEAGYHPTRYCFTRDGEGALRIYVTDFVMREAG